MAVVATKWPQIALVVYYCVKDLVHSELRYCNDGYHDCRNILEQRRRQVFPESLGQAPADSRTTQRADDGAERAREQSSCQPACRHTHRGAHQAPAKDARNELRWHSAACRIRQFVVDQLTDCQESEDNRRVL